MTPPDQTLAERVSALEVSVRGVSENQVALKTGMDQGFAQINGRLQEGATTNWSLILVGIVTAIGLYASAIRPITNDIARDEAAAATLADAVLKQNEIIVDLRLGKERNQEHIVEGAARTERISGVLTDLLTTRATEDKRLSVLEELVKVRGK